MNRTKQLIIFLNYASLGILLPVLNLILLKRGADLKTLPLLIASYSAAVLCFELPSGICADLHLVFFLPRIEWSKQGFFLRKPGCLNCRSGFGGKGRKLSA